jgi:hypothetical protein
MKPETISALMKWSDRVLYSVLVRQMTSEEVRKLTDAHTSLQDELIKEKNLPGAMPPPALTRKVT